jgi:hypothetical protein
VKLPELNSFDDREAKPLNISLHIGRRPLLAFGNSDGDLPMLRYAKSGPGARLALLLRHDDAEREFARARVYPDLIGRSCRCSLFLVDFWSGRLVRTYFLYASIQSDAISRRLVQLPNGRTPDRAPPSLRSSCCVQ